MSTLVNVLLWGLLISFAGALAACIVLVVSMWRGFNRPGGS